MSIFKRKTKELTSDTVPIGVSRTLPRPTEDDLKKISDSVQKLKDSKPFSPKVDPLFVQDISDRLYGPDSEAYVEALRKVNEKFRPREGKSFIEFYEPEIVSQIKERERMINVNITKETE